MAPTVIRSTLVPTSGLFQGGQPTDLIDLGTVKTMLDIDSGQWDAILLLFIAQVSQAIAVHCSRTFQVQTYSELVWTERDPYPWQLPSGLNGLQLSQWPLAGTPCLSKNAAPAAAGALGATSGGALTAANYFVRVTYTTPTGESPASPEVNLVVVAGSLLTVAAPPADPANVATGWNVYVGLASGAEQRQNGSPLALANAWTLPASGLLPGPAVPPYIAVTLNPNVSSNSLGAAPQNLIEGQDYLADYRLGQLHRLFPDNYTRRWEIAPIQVVYAAGYATLPADLQGYAIRLVTEAWFARKRDPKVRSQNIEGVYSAQYWFATGPGGGNFPPDVVDGLDKYRMPVIG